MTEQEKRTLRELAKQYAALAALDVQNERRTRAQNANDLIPGRPVVWINEIPWHEMDTDGEMRLVCEDAFARNMEWYFRSVLYRWAHFQADMVVENEYVIPKAYSNSGIGLDVSEKTVATDDRNHIVSHAFEDRLDSFEAVEALSMPVITAQPEQDRQKMDMALDVLDGILPVRLGGSYIYHAPWDVIPRLHGVTSVMIDLYERPELMHKTIAKFTEIGLSTMRQMEAQGLLDNRGQDLHCTPAYVSALKTGDEPVKLKQIWFRAMAQMFTDVSPAMLAEFEIPYAAQLAAECGLTYYGCCEALHNKIHLLKTIPNMRKIGVSPWADVCLSAEQIGSDYVFAHKPNPAFVSGRVDRETVSREIAAVIEACLANNCPYEFVLKDISTVSYRPENLTEWNEVVQTTIDRYYDRA